MPWPNYWIPFGGLIETNHSLKQKYMKQSIRRFSLATFITFLLLSAIQFISYAQDSTGTSKSTTITTESTTTTTWYTQPWVWVVGGAVLILLLVALLRGGGSNTDKTSTHTSRTTVIKDRDV